tara:strand:+ start:191 stop:427 length:237 start_codon:yes stop_codon:yes gene_type:complete
MEYYLGQIVIFPYNFAPKNFVKCNGMPMELQSNQPLFSLLGTKFGGNGIREFLLPKIEDPCEGLSYYICIAGPYPTRN